MNRFNEWIESRKRKNDAKSLTRLQKFWMDPIDILDELDEYESIWIQHSGCVWSECSAGDDTDDAYMGDNRDGDGQWYQYRTQKFCSNTAYSLYGLKKSDKNLIDSTTNFFKDGCTHRHLTFYVV